MPDQEQAIHFRHTRAPGYRILAANAVWGSVATNGTITVDLYVERRSAPETVTLYVEGSRAGQQELSPPDIERVIEREAQVGLLLTPETARAVAKYLMDRADEYDRLLGGEGETMEGTDADTG